MIGMDRDKGQEGRIERRDKRGGSREGTRGEDRDKGQEERMDRW
jgi:hypothetical protein